MERIARKILRSVHLAPPTKPSGGIQGHRQAHRPGQVKGVDTNEVINSAPAGGMEPTPA